MSTSSERIEELRRLYKEAYGKEISVEEATAMASRLIALYRQLMQKLPSEQKPTPPDALPPPAM